MACLDTNFLVELLRRNSRAEKKLEELTLRGETLTTTPLNACELFKGAYRTGKQIEETKKVRELLSHLDILDFSIPSCEVFGKIINSLRDKGDDVGEVDVLIACIVITHGEILVTNNVKHFSRISGLRLETF
ncbi:MAG: type II toxin-antitoxin system VapC family toxin [Methanosarcinales archaeon Met12]|nr:MAG: type II toxin-antitoxin system VapC family toxin [Methanosarcinales archaeon Met12]